MTICFPFSFTPVLRNINRSSQIVLSCLALPYQRLEQVQSSPFSYVETLSSTSSPSTPPSCISTWIAVRHGKTRKVLRNYVSKRIDCTSITAPHAKAAAAAAPANHSTLSMAPFFGSIRSGTCCHLGGSILVVFEQVHDQYR
jgi:hypothetical protein